MKAVVGVKAQGTGRRQLPPPIFVWREFFTDFCCLERQLIIELDGGQHAQAQEYDQGRTTFLESLGLRLRPSCRTSPILTFPRN